MKKLILLAVAAITGCTGIPKNVSPIDGFQVGRYLGTWYEIARLDHSFERGLTNVHAVYSKNDDGSIQVLNKGYDPESGRWKEARGKAYFVSQPDIGRLKVTFFWPFYGGYNIIELDKENYSYALVCGPDKSYLWLLARTPQLDKTVQDRMVEKARLLGFETENLIYVKQDL